METAAKYFAAKGNELWAISDKWELEEKVIHVLLQMVNLRGSNLVTAFTS